MPEFTAPWTIRAVQLDLARQMETVDTVCDFIEFAAHHGFNTLVLYLEARIRTASFPFRAPEESYTPEDMQRIVAHADQFGMQVIPALAMLAHTEQFLACPELAHLAEEAEGCGRFGKSGPQTMCPSLPETYPFLEHYLREIAAIFPAPHIHLGLDEAFNLGVCPRCRARMQEEGLGRIFTAHLARLHVVAADCGKRVWIWDDMFEFFPEALKDAPRDVVMCHWNYDEVIEAEGAAAHFANRWRQDWLALYAHLGFEAIICPISRNPRNVETFTKYARRHDVLGGLLTQWAMSAHFLPEFALAVAFTGEWWSNPTLTPGTAWRDAIDAVVPGARSTLGRALRLLAGTALGHPLSASIQHYLKGPLSAGEQAREAAVRAGLALLHAGRALDAPEGGHDTLNEIDIAARLELVHWSLRALLPSIYDPRRTEVETAHLQITARHLREELEKLLAQRTPMHDRLRPGMHPAHGAATMLRRLSEGLQPAWDRLARATTPEDWWMVLRLVLPDVHGMPRLQVEVEIDGAWQTILDGSWKPAEQMAGSHYTVQVPFTAAAAPTAVRLQGWGYGGQGVAFLELQNGATRLLPARVVSADGPVARPEALLRDDSLWADLGTRDILPAIHHPALAEARGTVTVALAPVALPVPTPSATR